MVYVTSFGRDDIGISCVLNFGVWSGGSDSDDDSGGVSDTRCWWPGMSLPCLCKLLMSVVVNWNVRTCRLDRRIVNVQW